MNFIKYLKEEQYQIPKIKKEKRKALNPKTNRMKNKRITKFLTTEIDPKDRTFKNLPRYSDKKPRCRFQDWLLFKGVKVDGYSVYKSEADDKWYGYSHRAVYGFSVGETIKPGHVGNKYQYGDDVNKKYQKIMDKEGYEEADKYLDTLTFDPYTIKDDEDAKQHALRFAKDVS